jgi:hypothetical protein
MVCLAQQIAFPTELLTPRRLRDMSLSPVALQYNLSLVGPGALVCTLSVYCLVISLCSGVGMGSRMAPGAVRSNLKLLQ